MAHCLTVSNPVTLNDALAARVARALFKNVLLYNDLLIVKRIVHLQIVLVAKR